MQRQSPASRIFIVGHTVKEIRNNLEHGLEKADFIADLSTEEPQALSLFDPLSLLFASKAVLPRCIRLMPVIRRRIRERKRLKRRV